MPLSFFKNGCLLAALASFTGASAAAAQEQGQSASMTEALHFLGKLNRPEALEPAGSHGSYGLDVGVGASSYAPPTTNPVLMAQLGPGADGTAAYSLPRVWVTKGLPIPVDFGVTLGSPAEAGFTQVTGMAQVALYESLAMPALSLRASYGRLYGMTGTSLTSTSGEVVGSYGFLRYFTIYAAAGAAHHSGTIEVRPVNSLSFSLADVNQVEQVSSVWYEPIGAVGLKIIAWPPFVSVTAQGELSEGNRKNFAAKLSYGL